MGEDRQDAHTTPPGRKLSVSEAAGELGISAEAVRSRIKRRTLRSIKEGPTVYVLLTTDQTRPDRDQTTPEQGRASAQTSDQSERLEDLREQVVYLRRQLDEEREARRRADTILVQLPAANAEQARTIRAIEAPASDEPAEAPETVEEAPEGAEPRSATVSTQEAAQRPWWRRMFGG
jgi:DNA-binding Lrp family transcriptional regulator